MSWKRGLANAFYFSADFFPFLFFFFISCSFLWLVSWLKTACPFRGTEFQGTVIIGMLFIFTHIKS